MTDDSKAREPALDELADDEDELGWDREQHGRMADFATDAEHEPVTEAWTAPVTEQQKGGEG